MHKYVKSLVILRRERERERERESGEDNLQCKSNLIVALG